MPRFIPSIALVGRALLLGGALATLSACSEKPAPTEPMRAVRTITVGEAGPTAGREYAGEVKARVESTLGFRVGGKVVSRAVSLGDAVGKGQLLAQLDPSDLRLGQESAQAGWRAAQANFDLAEADFKRYKDLHAQGFIGDAELQRREATLKSARSALEQARAQTGVQSHQADYARLSADAPGVVTAVWVEPGTVVQAGAPAFKVAQDGPRDVVFAVPEDRLEALRALVGHAGVLKVKVWGQSGPPLTASVREVAQAADPSTRTYLVKADLGSAAVRLGQTATVEVPAASATAGLRLPLTALFEHGGSSQVWVWEPSSQTVRMQAVQVLGSDGNEVRVGAGLSPGQIVVSAGVHVLTPGQKVKRYAASH